eukprot:jgi/Chlat1/3332/Chrsp222S03398
MLVVARTSAVRAKIGSFPATPAQTTIPSRTGICKSMNTTSYTSDPMCWMAATASAPLLTTSTRCPSLINMRLINFWFTGLSENAHHTESAKVLTSSSDTIRHARVRTRTHAQLKGVTSVIPSATSMVAQTLPSGLCEPSLSLPLLKGKLATLLGELLAKWSRFDRSAAVGDLGKTSVAVRCSLT